MMCYLRVLFIKTFVEGAHTCCLITYFVLIQTKASGVPCSSGWTAEIKITRLTCKRSSYEIKLEKQKTGLINLLMYTKVKIKKTINNYNTVTESL